VPHAVRLDLLPPALVAAERRVPSALPGTHATTRVLIAGGDEENRNK
jgi:hypothetical protein